MMGATLALRAVLVVVCAVLRAGEASEDKASQQCALPEQRDAGQPPRSIGELTALIAQYEAGLDALRRERAEAVQIARDAGSPEVIAPGVDFPTPGDGPVSEMDKWLEPVAWFHVGEKISAMAAMPAVPARGNRAPGSRSPPPPTYYAVGDVNGRLHFFKYPDERLLTQPYDTKHGAAVTAIGFGRRDEHLLVTAAADGSVHMHNITLPKAPRPVRTPKRKDGEPDAPAPPPPEPTPLTVEFDSVAHGPDDDGAAVTGLQIYRRHRHEMIVVANTAGSIRVMFANGTEYAASNTTALSNPPVSANKRGKKNAASKTTEPAADSAEPASPPPPLQPPAGVVAIQGATNSKIAQFIAISIGKAIGFFDLKKMSMIPSRCTGMSSNEVVTSMEYDVIHNNILYASTAGGKVLIARVGSDGNRVDCRVLRSLDPSGKVISVEKISRVSAASGAAEQPPSASPSPEDSLGDQNSTGKSAYLGAVHGYLLAGDVHGIVVYNTTSVQHRGVGSSGTLFRSHFQDTNAGLELAESPLMSIIAQPANDNSAVLLASKDGKLVVFKSKLPVPVDDAWDLSKTRMPIVAGAVLLVFGFQMYRRKRGRSSSRDDEMERLLSRAGAGGFGESGGRFGDSGGRFGDRAGRLGSGSGTRDPRFYQGGGSSAGDFGGANLGRSSRAW